MHRQKNQIIFKKIFRFFPFAQITRRQVGGLVEIGVFFAPSVREAPRPTACFGRNMFPAARTAIPEFMGYSLSRRRWKSRAQRIHTGVARLFGPAVFLYLQEILSLQVVSHNGILAYLVIFFHNMVAFTPVAPCINLKYVI